MSRPRLLGAALALLGIGGTVGWLATAVGLSDERLVPALLLVAVAALIPVCCYDDLGAADVFQPGTVVAAWYVLYVLIPGIYVVGSLNLVPNWVHPQSRPGSLVTAILALSIAGLVGYGLGYRWFRVRAGSWWGRRLRVPPGVLARRVMLPATILVLFGGLFKIWNVRALGGLSSDLVGMLSSSLREEIDVRFEGIPYFVSMMFDCGVLLLLFRAMITKRGWLLSLALTATAAGLGFLLGGKRSAIMPFFVLPVVWYHYLHRRIRVGTGLATIAAGGIVMAGLLFARALAPTISAGGLGAVGQIRSLADSPVRFYLDSPELNEFDMIGLAIQSRDRLLHETNGVVRGVIKYNFESLTYVVPRAVWSEKPVPEELGQLFYKDLITGPEGTGFGVGIVGALYLFWGVIGVVVGMWLLGVVFRWSYGAMAPDAGRPAMVYLYAVFIWDCFMFLRFGTLGFTTLFFLQFQLVGVLAVLWATSARSLPAAGPWEAGSPGASRP